MLIKAKTRNTENSIGMKGHKVTPPLYVVHKNISNSVKQSSYMNLFTMSFR